MSISFSVTGDQDVIAKFRAIAAVAQGGGESPLVKGAEIIRDAWIADAPEVSGDYKRSIRVEPVDDATVMIVSDMPYSRRLEFGFSGTDSLGRTYSQPPGGYARRAMDENRDAAIRAAADELAARMRAA